MYYTGLDVTRSMDDVTARSLLPVVTYISSDLKPFTTDLLLLITVLEFDLIILQLKTYIQFLR
jgi:hypothetical protein